MIQTLLYPLRRLHGFIHDKTVFYQTRKALIAKFIKPFKQKVKNNERIAFLVLTPEHSNFGDHALALSETLLLKKLGIDYIEITSKKISELNQHKLLSFMNGYPIFITGGGNLGTLWFSVELLTRQIISNNPNSDIILFPNTIFYENTEFGTQEKNKSVEIYNRHEHLHLLAREKYSFEIMNTLYNNVSIIPDMVLFLNKSHKQAERNGCLICLRSDCEKTMTDTQRESLVEQAHILFGNNITYTDMCIDHPVSPNDREYELNKKFSEFLSAHLVITDRLHGMIFSAITGTPCIVLESKSHKVRGCYAWISSLPYIKFADKPEDISELFNQIPNDVFYYDSSPLAEYYDRLSKHILDLF